MLRELAHRIAGRAEVSLDWDEETDELTLTLADEGGVVRMHPHPEDAAWAYNHPYVALSELPDNEGWEATDWTSDRGPNQQ